MENLLPPGLPFDKIAFGTVAAFLNCLGVCLKRIKRFPDEQIPNALAVAGGIMYPVVLQDYQPINFVVGFVSAACAVGFNQFKKQNTPPPAPPAAPATP